MQLDDCTFLIKSFLRPDCLTRLLLSIHRHYPRTPTIVVDDSGNGDARAVCAPYPWVQLIETAEKDVGISRGRNIGLLQVQTEYFVLLDDDCVFWILSDVELMRDRLIETGADIVCGPMCDLDRGRIRQSAMEFMPFEDRHLLVQADRPPGEEGWVHASNNFFLARTALRETVLWPEEIKTREHAPYFWLVHRMGGKVWMTHYSSVGHLSTNNDEYDRYRYRVDAQTDQQALGACAAFQEEHRLSWLTSELEDEFGPTWLGHSFRWRRLLSPWCDTQERFLRFAKKYVDKYLAPTSETDSPTA